MSAAYENIGYAEGENDGKGGTVSVVGYSEKTKKPGKTNPKHTAGFVSKLFFSWATSIIRLGNKRALSEDDLFPVLESERSKVILDKIKANWENEILDAKRHRRTPRLWRALCEICSRTEYAIIAVLKLSSSVSTLVLSVILWFFLRALSSDVPLTNAQACLFITGLASVGLVKVFCGHHADFRAKLCGMKFKTAFTALAYEKLLSLRRSSVVTMKTGCIVNLISNDAQTMELFVSSVQFGIAAPLKILVAMVIMSVLIGWQALTGMFFFFIITAYTISAARQFGKLRVRGAAVTDRRLAFMSEIIAGIREVKINAWEWNYRDLIRNIRSEEMRFIRLRSLILSSFSALYFTSTSLAALVSIATLLYSGVHVTAFEIFTLVVLLNMVRVSVVVGLASCLRGVVDGVTAIARMEKFLMEVESSFIETTQAMSSAIHRSKGAGQIKIQDIHSNGRKQLRNILRVDSLKSGKPLCLNFKYLTPLIEMKQCKEPQICFSEVSATWTNNESLALKDVSFALSGNRLAVITGCVGSGKTSLLEAILGEIPLTKGNISGSGQLAYAPQIPWIFSGSIRENILFGKPYCEEFYNNVLEACELTKDLQAFPRRDHCLIGEDGASLSGGQRSRVCLARAVYSDADILLLDDPLCSLDAKVRDHIFEKCITGMLSEKLRILVTHQLQYVTKADYIMFSKNGHISAQGTQGGNSVKTLLNDLTNLKSEKRNLDKGREMKDLVKADRGVEDSDNVLCGYKSAHAQGLARVAEDREVGKVTWGLYWEYFKAGSSSLSVVGLFVFFLFVQVVLLSPNWWLSRMSVMSHNDQKSGVTFGIYSLTVVASLILSTARCFWFYHCLLSSSENLHDSITLSVIKSPVLFFDTNPAGRILNRFSRDIGCMDHLLPRAFLWAVSMCLSSLCTILVPAGTNVWLLIPLGPMIVGFIWLGRYYLRASRELKRLEAISCSPVYSHFTDTVKGLEVIRASRMEEDFLDTFYRYQDDYTKALSMVISSNEWLGLRLDLMCLCMVTIIALGALLVTESPALAGMSLSFAFETLESIQYGVCQCSEVENFMTSVERVIAFTRLPSEPGYGRHTKPPEDWPEEGTINIRDLSMQYHEGGPYVLENVNLKIKAQEKIGVCGRTGAGKSSVIAALLRVPDPFGMVLIDGLDMGTINVQAARRAISVLSQNPLLFGGTLRRNLDPFNKLTDDEIWSALDKVQLQGTVRRLPGQLLYEVKQFGSNLSVGQRQLLCLARAMLQKCKILVLDEATANVDFKTESFVQEIIRERFDYCTVISIAHRLNAINNYDRVIMLDGGKLIECENARFDQM